MSRGSLLVIVLFESATPVPVITLGMPTTGVEILVKRAAPLP